MPCWRRRERRWTEAASRVMRPRSPSTSATPIRWWRRLCAAQNAHRFDGGTGVSPVHGRRRLGPGGDARRSTGEQEKVRLVMVPVGESRLELLEATSDDSTIAKFIAKRGEGLHHVCMRVPDLAATVAKLKGDGVRLVSEEIKTGAGGHRYVFVHPQSTGGVLLELVESGHL